MKLRALTYPSFLAFAAVVVPIIAYAQTQIDSLIARISTTANYVISLLFVIATLVFLWGIVKFIASAGDEAGKKQGKALMTWGILGLAVMAAAWGIVNVLIQYVLGGGTSGTYRIPVPR